MCDEGTIACQLWEITKKLTDKNVGFSINMSFKDFNFSASCSQKVQDSPAFPEKRKRKSPSQKAKNLKRLVEQKKLFKRSWNQPHRLKILQVSLFPAKMVVLQPLCLVISVNTELRQKVECRPP